MEDILEEILNEEILKDCGEPEEEPVMEKAGCRFSEEQYAELLSKMDSLQDLFVRRLSDDKQKRDLIDTLKRGAEFAFIEPFINDIILLLDRLEKAEDDFSASVYEELYDIVSRRGVNQIEVTANFNPELHKAVKVEEDPEAEKPYVSRIIRNGYTFAGRVIRPAEVVVARPNK